MTNTASQPHNGLRQKIQDRDMKKKKNVVVALSSQVINVLWLYIKYVFSLCRVMFGTLLMLSRIDKELILEDAFL